MREIRRARLEDLDQIMQIVREAQAYIATFGIDQWQDGYPERSLIESDILNDMSYVVTDGAIIAYAALQLTKEDCYSVIDGAWLTNEGEYATMHRTCVADQARRSGAATELTEHLEKLARQSGKASLRVDTHPGNVAMNAFLQKHGYAYCGEVDYAKLVSPGFTFVRVAYEKLLIH